MKISEVIKILEDIAPSQLQESYDNSGLIVGNPNDECSKALICLDSTEEIIDEAMEKGCDLVIAHHPIVFTGLKKLNGKNYIERVVIKAIKNDIAIYAIHTNLDNVLHQGVNSKIAEKLKLSNCKILKPRRGDLNNLITYVPMSSIDQVRMALGEAGGGSIGNYDFCTFMSEGKGTFRGNQNSNPTVGRKGEIAIEPEMRLELVFPSHMESKLLKALRESHPYEEIAYSIVPIKNSWQDGGSGLIGDLDQTMTSKEFLQKLRSDMSARVIRHTAEVEKVQKVAVCGGSGSFLLSDAIASGADVFVTGDFKYHQFFDAENKLMICDIGHYESEQFTIELIGDILSKKLPNFALIFAQTGSNPIHYFY